MNENEFSKLLDSTVKLTPDQHCQLLNQLHTLYRANYINMSNYREIAWRVKQAWQLIHFTLHPPKQ